MVDEAYRDGRLIMDTKQELADEVDRLRSFVGALVVGDPLALSDPRGFALQALTGEPYIPPDRAAAAPDIAKAIEWIEQAQARMLSLEPIQPNVACQAWKFLNEARALLGDRNEI